MSLTFTSLILSLSHFPLSRAPRDFFFKCGKISNKCEFTRSTYYGVPRRLPEGLRAREQFRGSRYKMGYEEMNAMDDARLF